MLLEELRRDLPNARNRHDQHAETLQAATMFANVCRKIKLDHVPVIR